MKRFFEYIAGSHFCMCFQAGIQFFTTDTARRLSTRLTEFVSAGKSIATHTYPPPPRYCANNEQYTIRYNCCFLYVYVCVYALTADFHKPARDPPKSNPALHCAAKLMRKFH
jgi:hypothetical protein